MPPVDHRVRERLERVVHGTDALKAQQQAAEGIFPGKHALDGSGAFCEDGRIEMTLVAAFVMFAR